MSAVRAGELPAGALLDRYRHSGAYTDCFVADMPAPVSQAAFVEAFYTTAVFRAERLVLRWLAAKPSTDAQAGALARGHADVFAAWRVEDRADDQILLCDFQGRTRSWLMSQPLAGPGRSGTRLYFGSAVVPVTDRQTGEARMGAGFRALLGFHKVYSRVLLSAAVSRLGDRATTTA